MDWIVSIGRRLILHVRGPESPLWHSRFAVADGVKQPEFADVAADVLEKDRPIGYYARAR